MTKKSPEFERHESDQDADYTQDDLDFMDSDDPLNPFGGVEHLIRNKLSRVLLDLAHSNAHKSRMFLDIPYTELMAYPDIARKYMGKLQQLSRMLRERIPAGPIDPTAILPGKYKMELCALERLVESTKTVETGKSFRKKQKDKSDIAADNRIKARKPEREKWQEEANKVWKKQPKWSRNYVAENICHLFDAKAGTIRKKIKKPIP